MLPAVIFFGDPLMKWIMSTLHAAIFFSNFQMKWMMSYCACCNIFQRSLDEMDDVVYCPRCQAVVIREQDATLNLGYCLVCCFSFCTECEQPWHQVNMALVCLACVGHLRYPSLG